MLVHISYYLFSNIDLLLKHNNQNIFQIINIYLELTKRNYLINHNYFKYCNLHNLNYNLCIFHLTINKLHNIFLVICFHNYLLNILHPNNSLIIYIILIEKFVSIDTFIMMVPRIVPSFKMILRYKKSRSISLNLLIFIHPIIHINL